MNIMNIRERMNSMNHKDFYTLVYRVLDFVALILTLICIDRICKGDWLPMCILVVTGLVIAIRLATHEVEKEFEALNKGM